MNTVATQRDPHDTLPVNVPTDMTGAPEHFKASRQVFRLENNACVAFNGADPLYMPSYRKDPMFMWPRQLKWATYSCDPMPYVALVLVKPRYEHSVLQTLRLGRDFGLEYIEHEKGGVWQLSAGTQALWLQLQDILFLTVQLIQNYCGGFLSTLELKPPRRRPTDFGFTKQYKKEEDARRAVLDSRGSFDLLFAYVAFYISNSSSLVAPSTPVATVGWEGMAKMGFVCLR